MRHIFTPLFLSLCFIARAQDGVIDGSFGTGGKQVTTLTGGTAYNEIQKITVLPNGKILHAFSMFNTVTGNYDFALARYEVNGELDITFDGDAGNGNGIVLTDFGDDEVATALTVRADGKIVVVGYKATGGLPGGPKSFAIARYNSNGTLDNTFDGESGNGNGKITTTFGTDDAAYGVAEAGGITVVVGYTWSGSRFDFAVARYNNNGTLDVSFDGNSGNGNGRVTTSIDGILDQAYAIAIQPDAKIVVAGYSFDGSFSSFAMVRYNINGTLDNTFDGDAGNGNGIVTTVVGPGGNDLAFDIAAQANGKILVTGSTFNGADYDFALVRYNANGTLDVTFDGDGGSGNGIVTLDITGAGSDDRAYALGVQGDGKILIAGATRDGFINPANFAIARFNTDGSLDDNNFNSGGDIPGVNIIDFGADDVAFGMAPQGTSIILGGSSTGNLATTRLINSSTILPVDLRSFTASKQSGSVMLNWQTLNEVNFSHFELERSSDGSRFTKIANVQAAGSGTDVKNYSYNDLQPLSTVNFYRLKIVNTNGSVSYSKIVVVRFNARGALMVFPNPVKNTMNIQVTQPAGPVKIEVLDVSGRLVKAFNLQSSGSTLSTSVDVSSLLKGVYFVKVNEETIKVVKE